MRTLPLYFGLFSATALFGAVAACSSTTTTTTAADAGTDGGGTGAKDGSGGGKDTGGGGDEDSGGGTTDPDEKCAEETTLQACGQCCVDNHKAGYKVFQDSLLACACEGTGAAGDAGGDGPCATDCAKTICAATPAQPDQACNACLQKSIGSGGDCNAQVVKDCQANTDCVAQQKCVTPCQGKK